MLRKKSDQAYRTISEAATILKVQPHILRFWEKHFPQINPMKRAGGRRYYSPQDIRFLARIRDLLYKEGYTVKGVQRLLRKKGADIFEENDNPPLDAPVDSLPLPQESKKHWILTSTHRKKADDLLQSMRQTIKKIEDMKKS